MAGPLAGVASEVAIAGLSNSLDELRRSIDKNLTLADKFQKQALSFGVGITDLNEKLTPTLKELRGSIDQRLWVGINTMAAGLTGNNIGISKLINSQQITGQVWQNTASVYAQIGVQGRMQIGALNNLAITTIEAAGIYGVQSSKLVEMLASLGTSFTNMNLAGFDNIPQVTEAIVMLGAQLGPQYQQSLTNALNFVFDEGFDTLGKLATLGIGDIREQLQRAHSAEDALGILRNSIKTAASNFESMSNSHMVGLGAAVLTFGKNSKDIVILNQQLQAGGRETQKANFDFAKNISTIMQEVWNPIKSFFMNNYDKFLMLGETVGSIVSDLTSRLGESLQKIIPNEEQVLKIRNGILDFSIRLSNTFDFLLFSLEGLVKGISFLIDSPLGKAMEMYISIENKRIDLMNSGFMQFKNLFSSTKNSVEEDSKRTIKSPLTKFLEGIDRNSIFGEIERNTKQIAENTAQATPSNFMQFTATSLDNSMRAILGLNQDKALEYLKQLVELGADALDKNNVQPLALSRG